MSLSHEFKSDSLNYDLTKWIELKQIWLKMSRDEWDTIKHLIGTEQTALTMRTLPNNSKTPQHIVLEYRDECAEFAVVVSV